MLILGSILSDVEDLDLRYTVLSEGKTIHATADRVAIKHHRYDAIRFQDFVLALTTHPLPSFPSRPLPPPVSIERGTNTPHSPITLNGLFHHLDSILDEKMLVIADVGESLFAAADLHVRRRFDFLSPAY